MSPAPRLSQQFEPRANGLNLIRLLLASSVIVYHSFPLAGERIPWWPVEQVARDLSVDGFFAISGFLILSSWERLPNWRAFLVARSLRIFPGLWVCLIVTAAVIAPLGILLSGHGFPAHLAQEAAEYPLRFALLQRFGGFDIAGTPSGVPYPGVWNGSLWTLRWEFLCYLGVLAIGLLGILRYRASVPIMLAMAWLAVASSSAHLTDSPFVAVAGRFALMFLAGSTVWSLRDRLPVSRSLIAAAGVVTAAASALPDYRLIAAFPIAYMFLAAGSLMTSPRWNVQFDCSYGMYIYGFPVQQFLALAGVATLGVVPFIVVALAVTAILAAASWKLIERPSLRLKRRLAPRRLTMPTLAVEDRSTTALK